jgi:outer membrane protein OmpA-like peptidoglycan-associated protein
MRRVRESISSLGIAVIVTLVALLAPLQPLPASSNQATPATVPSRMAAPQPFNPTTFSMSLFMTPPTSDGGSNIEEYQFTGYPGGITHNIFTNEIGEWWVPNLAPGTAYSFTVRARNATGWSLESSRSVTVSTLALPPPPPPPPAPTIELVPIPSTLAIRCAVAGQAFSTTLTGIRLTGITSASLNGRAIEITQANDSSLVLSFPALAAGSYDMVYGSRFGSVTHMGALRVCDAPGRPRTTSPTILPTTSPTLSATVSPTISVTVSATASPTASSSSATFTSNSSSPSSSPPATTETFKSDTSVFFAPDSARLTNAARSALADLASEHLRARSSFFVIEGYAAASSNTGFARVLAMRRAQAVAEYLRSIGVTAFFRITSQVGDSGSSEFRRVDVFATSRQ